jgi:predicted transcriptional regulator
MLILLSLFLYGAASSESKSVVLQGLLADVKIGDVARFDADGISADATLSELGDRMLRDRRTVYPVFEAGEVTGIVTLDAFRDVKQGQRDTELVRSIANTDVPRVDVSDDAFDGLTALNSTKAGVALVESEGALVGVVSREEFSAFLQFREDGVGFSPRTAV